MPKRNNNYIWIGIIAVLLILAFFQFKPTLFTVYGTGCNFISSQDLETNYQSGDYISVDRTGDGILEAYGYKEDVVSVTLQNSLVTTPLGNTVYQCNDNPNQVCLMTSATTGFVFDATLTPTNAKTNCCGNNQLEGSEQCDGINLNSSTCGSLNYDSGTLQCTNSCTFDTTYCILPSTCGNGLLNYGEECDLTNLNLKTCSTYSYTAGTLGCTNTCLINKTGCFNKPVLTGFGPSTPNITSNYEAVQNLVLDKPLIGTINFLQSVDMKNIVLNSDTTIYDYKVTITEPKLNKLATVTLYKVNFIQPRILRDNGVCGACSIISYNPFVFSVPGFSTYEVIETNTTVADITETTATATSTGKGSYTLNFYPQVNETTVQPFINIPTIPDDYKPVLVVIIVLLGWWYFKRKK